MPTMTAQRVQDKDKTEPQSRGPLAHVGIPLIKGFKDAVVERGVDTNAGVGELNDQTMGRA